MLDVITIIISNEPMAIVVNSYMMHDTGISKSTLNADGNSLKSKFRTIIYYNNVDCLFFTP